MISWSIFDEGPLDIEPEFLDNISRVKEDFYRILFRHYGLRGSSPEERYEKLFELLVEKYITILSSDKSIYEIFTYRIHKLKKVLNNTSESLCTWIDLFPNLIFINELNSIDPVRGESIYLGLSLDEILEVYILNKVILALIGIESYLITSSRIQLPSSIKFLG